MTRYITWIRIETSTGILVECAPVHRGRKQMVPKLGLLFAGAITFFLSAQISNAQSEQPFVLACAAENYNPDIKIKLTINLANGTVSIEDTNPYKTDTTQAAVKQVTDQKITFNSTTGVTYVLD